MDKYDEVHKTENLRGPGDARPTALQILQDDDLVGKMTDKVFVVTGASSGIGVETGRALAATGGKVYLTVRDLAKGKQACHDFLEPGRVELLEMDNGSLASVRTAAANLLRTTNNRLNALVCNAGIMAPPFALSADGFESQLATNHLAHFLFFSLVRDALLTSSTPSFHSRVVVVSSMGHQMGEVNFGDYNYSNGKDYNPFQAYGQSKTANIYMANEIENRYGAQGLHGLSLNPGGIWSGLQQYLPAEVLAGMKARPGVDTYMKSAAQGASTSVRAAVGKVYEGKGGLYLEDCDLARPNQGPEDMKGWAPHIHDKEKAARLWGDSLQMVGLTE